MKRKINYKIAYYYYNIIFVIVMFFMVGMVFNFVAVSNNQGKMPVYAEWHYSDNSHFTFQDKSEVKHWVFTDIFNIKQFLYFSIGDFLMILSFISLTILIGFMRFSKWKIVKKYEKKN